MNQRAIAATRPIAIFSPCRSKMLTKRPLPFRFVAIAANSYFLFCLLCGGCGWRWLRASRLLARRLQNRRVWFVENENCALDDHVDHFRLSRERLNRRLIL